MLQDGFFLLLLVDDACTVLFAELLQRDGFSIIAGFCEFGGGDEGLIGDGGLVWGAGGGVVC